MQPTGPVLLVGCSIAGCAIASAMAAVLERMHRQPLLVLLDGCASPPQEVRLHEPTWCDSYVALNMPFWDFCSLMVLKHMK